MKFGEFIKQINVGELTQKDLIFLGNRYYEKYDNSFMRLFHHNFSVANFFRATPSGKETKEYCDFLISQISQIEKPNGWMYSKITTLLNTVLQGNIRILNGTSDSIEPRKIKSVISDFNSLVHNSFKPIELDETRDEDSMNYEYIPKKDRHDYPFFTYNLDDSLDSSFMSEY